MVIKPAETPLSTVAALRRAARQTGNSFDSLLAIARVESGGKVSARSASSSAAGMFQFTRSTWLDMARRHGRETGIDPSASDAALLALRFDPETSAVFAGHLANENRTHLERALGRKVSDEEVYMAHFLGASDATRLLQAVGSEPGRDAARMFPRPAASNRPIFFDAGRPRTVAEVAGLLADRFQGAGGDTASVAAAEDTAAKGTEVTPQPTARAFASRYDFVTPGSRQAWAEIARRMLEVDARADA